MLQSVHLAGPLVAMLQSMLHDCRALQERIERLETQATATSSEPVIEQTSAPSSDDSLVVVTSP